MTQFTFAAPTLSNASATARDELAYVFHDAPEASERLAKHKKLAFWLKAEIDKRGLAASGPEMDEGGWTITTPAKEGFVFCIISVDSGGEKPFQLIIAQIGDSGREYAHTSSLIEALLKEADEVTELKVDRSA